MRIAQTELDEWLEWLSHGIQAELLAPQTAAQQLLNIFIVGVPERVRRQLEARQISGRVVVVTQDCPSAPDHETG